MPNTAPPTAQGSPRTDFRAAQAAFAAHIRDPERAPRPADVEERRMAIYRNLFFGSIEGLLAGTFRVTRRALGDEHWRALVRDFMVHHRAATPLFAELSQEFLAYLGGARAAQQRKEPGDDPPYLLELVHYEWVKWALKVSDDEPDPRHADPNGDLLDGQPVVSPLAWNLAYRFAVHQVDPEAPPTEPSAAPAHLLVYRNRADEVEFLELNAVTHRLLALLQQNNDAPGEVTLSPGATLTGRAALERIATELRHPAPEKVVAAGASMLRNLRRRDVILGTRRDDSAASPPSPSA
jgi:hypothetical protein